MNVRRIAEGFILHAIQEWGDSEEKRIAAVQAVLDAAGFEATATCWPVFGGIWPRPCEGPEGDRATGWLRQLTANMKRGHVEDEIDYVVKAIQQVQP